MHNLTKRKKDAPRRPAWLPEVYLSRQYGLGFQTEWKIGSIVAMSLRWCTWTDPAATFCFLNNAPRPSLYQASCVASVKGGRVPTLLHVVSYLWAEAILSRLEGKKYVMKNNLMSSCSITFTRAQSYLMSQTQTNLVVTEFFCDFGGRDQIQIVQRMIRRSSRHLPLSPDWRITFPFRSLWGWGGFCCGVSQISLGTEWDTTSWTSGVVVAMPEAEAGRGDSADFKCISFLAC